MIRLTHIQRVLFKMKTGGEMFSNFLLGLYFTNLAGTLSYVKEGNLSSD